MNANEHVQKLIDEAPFLTQTQADLIRAIASGAEVQGCAALAFERFEEAEDRRFEAETKARAAKDAELSREDHIRRLQRDFALTWDEACDWVDTESEARRIFAMNEARLESVRPARDIEADRTCALYRHYDGAGELLYVGIAYDPDARRKQHLKDSPWSRFASRMAVEWFDTRTAAATAERTAIHREDPLFNKAHASPSRNDRAARYLMTNGAFDLLRPAI